jgi:UDP-2,3-diacylglucosamine pyrophosphatase LpxH
MKPDKYEKMAHKWFSNALSVGNTVEQGERDLAKLLRRVYRMGHKDGYCKGGHDLAKILKETR